MASWTDGAAYAPIERPDGFATPEVEPLEVAPRQSAQTPGPMPTPSGFAPMGPTVPLESVRTSTPTRRDPSEPFLVSGGLLTIASSMGDEQGRDPREPFATYGQDLTAHTAVDALPPPTGAPLPMPTPVATRGMTPQQQSTQRTLVFLAVAACLIGLTIPATGPWMLFVAGLLTVRTVPVTGRTGAAAMGVGLTLLVLGGLLPVSAAAALARLSCLIFGSVFTWLAIQRSRPQRR